MDEHPAPSHRTSATVRDRQVAEQVVIDLTEHGIAPDRVRTHPVGPVTPRATGEQDLGFTESAGKTMGAGWLIGFLVGALAGALGVTLLFAPPWESALAAGITLAVAIGVGYIAGGLGFLQSAIARSGETGGGPLTRQDPGHTEEPQALAGGEAMEIVVEAVTEEEARLARTVFDAHDIRRG
jgi:hypothetical protein